MRGLRRTGTPAVENLAPPSWAPAASAMRVRPTLPAWCATRKRGRPFRDGGNRGGITSAIDEEATQANENAIANTGFILVRDAVLVTDPGGCLTDGERLRATIAQMTSLPVRYVVMSHVHPDHIFGASAFLQDGPVFVGHARLAETLRQRGTYYREKLSALIGPEQTERRPKAIRRPAFSRAWMSP